MIKMTYAANLDEAYKKGYFTGSMTRWELMERITKYNPELRWYANKTHRGLFDTHRGKFICGIPHNLTIPKFSIQRYDKKQERKVDFTNMYGEYVGTEIIQTDDLDGLYLARGWPIIFKMLKKRGYKINEKGLV